MNSGVRTIKHKPKKALSWKVFDKILKFINFTRIIKELYENYYTIVRVLKNTRYYICTILSLIIIHVVTNLKFGTPNITLIIYSYQKKAQLTGYLRLSYLRPWPVGDKI